MTSPILGLAAKVGKAFSSIFMDATLTREVPGDGPAYDPGPSTTVIYPCKALVDTYGAFTHGQGLVAATDMKVIILATSLSVEPKPLDRIVVAAQGFSGQIVAGDTPGQPPVGTDPAKTVWELRCQA